MFLLIGGIIQFGKITYIYYSLQKTVNTVASYLAVQNGVNFCPDAGDSTIAAAIQFALTGTTDGSGPPAIFDLTPDMITVTAQCLDPVTLTLPNGYLIRPRIPYLLVDPIPLRPKAVMAYGGAS